ncbi:hypothetical protein S7335_5096 [Synechococcus sp. PCC 7335]|nr:hypothetical protein S7335_5096 [Synechococcus sp. PCC 7335]
MIEDVMDELFVEEMPRPTFLKARKDVDNWLITGVFERRCSLALSKPVAS